MVIKPCPFCKSKQVDVVVGYCEAVNSVRCFECGANGAYKATKQEAITAWNTRVESEADDESCTIQRKVRVFYPHATVANDSPETTHYLIITHEESATILGFGATIEGAWLDVVRHISGKITTYQNITENDDE